MILLLIASYTYGAADFAATRRRRCRLRYAYIAAAACRRCHASDAAATLIRIQRSGIALFLPLFRCCAAATRATPAATLPPTPVYFADIFAAILLDVTVRHDDDISRRALFSPLMPLFCRHRLKSSHICRTMSPSLPCRISPLELLDVFQQLPPPAAMIFRALSPADYAMLAAAMPLDAPLRYADIICVVTSFFAAAITVDITLIAM